MKQASNNTPADEGARASRADVRREEERVELLAERDVALLAIATTCLGLETLETRNSDSLDFHDLGVGGVREALEAAYQAGREAK